MSDKDRILTAVYKAIDEVNTQLPKGVSLEKSPDESLYGKSGKLESLDFVTLIMEVEEKVRDEFGIDVTIADEQLLSKEKSPFLTIGTLADYLQEFLKANAKAGSGTSAAGDA
jgi:acyl carrier protein